MLSGPPINTAVTVDAASWEGPCRTRVEGLDHEVVVAAPLHELDARSPALGAPLVLHWQSDRGPMSLEVTLVAKELRNVPLWRLQPDGPVVTTQRRHHARADVLVPVRLDTEHGAIHGSVVDLSEGGVRMVHRTDHPLRTGDPVQVQLCTDDLDVTLGAEVLRVQRQDERTSVGVRFLSATEAEADAIRRHVFAWQAKARRWA